MKLTNHGPVPVYTISGSSTARPLPEWLARKRRRSLKQDPEYASRIELLQDFEFEEASSCIRASDDGDWVVSTGTYKPQIHVHYLPHLSLSYARHTNGENQTFLLLSSDYSKQLHLQTDRFLEFHTPGGCHYTTRIPRYGRDLVYDKRSAEALIPAVGVEDGGSGEVYRLNLEVGRFMRSYAVDVGGDDFTSAGGGALQGGINTGSVNTGAIAEDSHNLLAFGTSIGTVEFWDPRSRNRVGTLPAPPSFTDSILPNESLTRAEITSLKFNTSGLTLATGSSTGLIHLYDLRSPTPLLKKDQGYGYPIHTLTFLENTTRSTHNYSTTDTPKILSADKRIIKIWDTTDGSPWTHVEAAVDLHNVAWCRDTGMLLTSNEGRQQHSFFVPSLGPAPRWCSFLDNLVEEMADDADDPNAFHSSSSHRGGEVYDNYKFVTAPQLAALGLEDKIGTGLLKPYMHGYFMRQELYEEARVLAQPEVWAERRQQSIREKVEKERASRIRGTKGKLDARVNKEMADRILEREEKNERRKAKRELRKRDEEADSGDDDITRRENGETNGMDLDVEDDEAAASKVPEHKQRETLLTDPRFADLFRNEDYAIDETSHTFRQLNPSTTTANGTTDRSDARGRTAVEEEEEERAQRRQRRDSTSASDSDSDSGAESEDEHGAAPPRRTAEVKSAKEKGRISSSSYTKAGHRPREEREQARLDRRDSERARRGEKMAPRMMASSSGRRPGMREKERSFGERVRMGGTGGVGRGRNSGGGIGGGAGGNVVGEREMTFEVGGGSGRGRGRGRGGGGRGGDRRGDRGSGRARGDRRSASLNTFRRI